MSLSKLRDPDWRPSEEMGQNLSANSSPMPQFKTKRDLHEYLDRSGHLVMPLKNASCTLDYLRRVMASQIWSPLYLDAKLRSCYQPPKKELVFKELTKALTAQGLPPFGFKDATKISMDYLLLCLSTLCPDHRFFQPGYYPDDAKTKSKRRLAEGFMIRHNEDFYQSSKQQKSGEAPGQEEDPVPDGSST